MEGEVPGGYLADDDLTTLRGGALRRLRADGIRQGVQGQGQNDGMGEQVFASEIPRLQHENTAW